MERFGKLIDLQLLNAKKPSQTEIEKLLKK
jgi:hypothetical protein